MFEFIHQRRFSDPRGTLDLMEASKELPFLPKRFFWVYGVPEGSERGFHAHKTGHQVLFCLDGAIELTLRNHDSEKSILLNSGGPGVWVKNMVWAQQKFLSEGALLVVFASNEFDESDYIRDFVEFTKLSKQGL